MTLKFDHAIIIVTDLERAIADYKKLGFNVFYGGAHASGETHNGLIVLPDGAYLELLAPTDIHLIDSEAAEREDSLLGIFHRGDGFIGYAFLADDIEAVKNRANSNGVALGDVIDGGRETTDGEELRWRSTMMEDVLSPFVIQDVTPRERRVPPEKASHSNGCTGLVELVVAVADLKTGTERYQKLLGMTPTQQNDESTQFELPNCTLTLMVPAHDYVAKRGPVPYLIKLRTDDPDQIGMLDTTLTHGANFEFVK